MQDFLRIGGEIISAPLNENFRRLANAITISNANLIFPEENATVNTITDMLEIPSPMNAQTCYVISSGELYRYNAKKDEWIKIADFGQTFRQGFLNSGAVVLEEPVKLKTTDKTVLITPRMLVYFKNKEGDNKYLKGMYLIDSREVSITSSINGAGAYSFFVNERGEYSIVSGMPSVDNVNKVFIGTFIVGTDNKIIGEDFVYTLPDIAYTADRGTFLMNGGQASGMNLIAGEDGKVNRMPGYYYDEGINYTQGQTDDFPVDTDNGSNFDLKYYEAVEGVNKFYYMVPINGLSHGLSVTDKLLTGKYWDSVNQKLTDVPEGYYTIQQHLVTPNGQNIMLYGTAIYNSMSDAQMNLNSTFGVDVNFPYVEATRVIVGNVADFSPSDGNYCMYYSLGRLAQVGTISPVFADTAFKIYNGKVSDNTPATMRFSLDALSTDNFNDLYTLKVRPYKDKDYVFSLGYKYITDDVKQQILTNLPIDNTVDGIPGYEIATHRSVEDLRERINAIEKEIWNVYINNNQRYEQSIRYRLFHLEETNDAQALELSLHNNRITSLEQGKVNKSTSINGYKLGDTLTQNETKNIVLKTGDIAEGYGNGDKINLWYTDERVKNHTDVANATRHINTVSKSDTASTHTVVNPHNLSTDDIKYLTDTQKVFVTPDSERRIRADRLPDDTIAELKRIDDKNLDSITIDSINGSTKESTGERTNLGEIRNIEIYEYGTTLSVTGDTLTLECVGQIDENEVMMKKTYATVERMYPDIYTGYVDNAINAAYAEHVHGIAEATAEQYYGTNEEGQVGIFDLPKYVTTVDAEDFTTQDQIIFTPANGSIDEEHLGEELKAKLNNNYHTILSAGQIISNEVNTINFGNNLKVSVENNTVTVNATASEGSGSSTTSFANLDDVSVVYTGNEGKVIVVNNEGTGLTVEDMPSLNNYMLKSLYVDPTNVTKIRHASLSDKATVATTANNSLTVNGKSVDDTKTTNGYLWTAAQIISNTSAQIAAEGVTTYSGTTVPSNSLGKNGDIYVLIES